MLSPYPFRSIIIPDTSKLTPTRNGAELDLSIHNIQKKSAEKQKWVPINVNSSVSQRNVNNVCNINLLALSGVQ